MVVVVESLDEELELELSVPVWDRPVYSLLSRYPSLFLSACENPRPRSASDAASEREMRPSPSVSVDENVPPVEFERVWPFLPSPFLRSMEPREVWGLCESRESWELCDPWDPCGP